MPKVKYANNSEESEVDSGTELRAVTQDKGWHIPYGCEDGLCGTCVVKVEGADSLSAVEEKEEMTLTAMGVLDGEHRLACQCKVTGDVTIQTH